MNAISRYINYHNLLHYSYVCHLFVAMFMRLFWKVVVQPVVQLVTLFVTKFDVFVETALVMSVQELRHMWHMGGGMAKRFPGFGDVPEREVECDEVAHMLNALHSPERVQTYQSDQHFLALQKTQVEQEEKYSVDQHILQRTS